MTKKPMSPESLDFYDGPYGGDDKDLDAIFAEIEGHRAAERAKDLEAGKRTSYGVWEDDPTILHFYGDGSASGHIYNGTEWKEVHPADVGHKASVMSEEDFRRRFPDIGMPVFRT